MSRLFSTLGAAAALAGCIGYPPTIYTTPNHNEYRRPIDQTPPTEQREIVWASQLFGTCRSGVSYNTANNTRTDATTICRPDNVASKVFDGEIRQVSTGYYHHAGYQLSGTGTVIFACPAPGQKIAFKHIAGGTYLPEVKLSVPRGCVAPVENIRVRGLNGLTSAGPAMLLQSTRYQNGVTITPKPGQTP